MPRCAGQSYLMTRGREEIMTTDRKRRGWLVTRTPHKWDWVYAVILANPLSVSRPSSAPSTSQPFSAQPSSLLAISPTSLALEFCAEYAPDPEGKRPNFLEFSRIFSNLHLITAGELSREIPSITGRERVKNYITWKIRRQGIIKYKWIFKTLRGSWNKISQSCKIEQITLITTRKWNNNNDTVCIAKLEDFSYS